MDPTIWLGDGHWLSRGATVPGDTDTAHPCDVCGAGAGAPCQKTESDRIVDAYSYEAARWHRMVRESRAAVASLRRERPGPYPPSEWDSAIDAALVAMDRVLPVGPDPAGDPVPATAAS